MATASSLTQADITAESPLLLPSESPPLLNPPLAPTSTTATTTTTSTTGQTTTTTSTTTLPPPPPYISLTIKQDSLTVTLDGPTLAILSLALIGAIHSLQPATLALLITLTTTTLFVRNDYRNFLALGPGGTPSTPLGYLQINWFKLWALRDPFAPLATDGSTTPASGLLIRTSPPSSSSSSSGSSSGPSSGCCSSSSPANERKESTPLPYRNGPRPQVAGIAPQRQLNQRGSEEAYESLRRILEAHARAHASEFGTGTSCFEKHGLGLFARAGGDEETQQQHQQTTPPRIANQTCRGEICHVHDSDHSLHLSLHPDDAREVISKGWGQRHPLARGRTATTSSSSSSSSSMTATSRLVPVIRMPVPPQFTMVYAPRSRDELAVVCRIIEAAAWWVVARDIPIDLLGEA